jgi:hypothetical protein
MFDTASKHPPTDIVKLPPIAKMIVDGLSALTYVRWG